MPWKPADADRHAKGLTPRQKRVWARVANAALTRCEAKGGRNCEASAIRQATSTAKGLSEALKVEGDALELLREIAGEIPEGDAPDELEEAVSGSFEARQESVRQALRKIYVNPSWAWPRATFDDEVIYELEQAGQPTIWQRRTYTIDEAGNVTFGEPEDVVITEEVKPKPKPGVTESDEPAPIAEGEETIDGEYIPLVEKAVRRDGSTLIKVIKPGWGNSGYYSQELLEGDGPKVFTKGTKMYLDHPTRTEEKERPERSLRDLAAVFTSDARWMTEGPAGPGLYADAKITNPQFREVLPELAEHIGVSIRARGAGKQGQAEGRKGRIIEKIVAGGHSVDFVTQPGAGGQVIDLFESARPAEDPEEEDMPELEEVQRQVTQLEETNRTITTERDTERERADRAETALRIREARDVVRVALETSRLPRAVVTRLIERLSADPPTHAEGDRKGQLDRDKLVVAVKEAAKAELTYLAEATGSNRIRGMGDGGNELTPETPDLKETSEALEQELQGLGLSESAAKSVAAGR